VPQIAGDAAFYSWATSLPNYYRPARWEWGEVRGRLARAGGSINLLEIGCGTGNFLQMISAEPNVCATGIDNYSPSVETARAKNLDVECMDLDHFMAAFPERRFDVVCAFHCLEHVVSPKVFLNSASKALAPGGVVMFSVPYSPTSEDLLKIDPLNLPPHHLTQWNSTSLRRLAAEAGMEIDIQTDTGIFGASLVKSWYWYFLSNLPGNRRRSRVAALFEGLAHPMIFAKSLHFALTRDRIGGIRAGDTALACFRR